MNFGSRRMSRTLTFKYVNDRYDGKLVPRPRVEIRLINGTNIFRIAMLVDSGADTSFIPKEVADILQLRLSEPKTSRSASGPFQTAHSTVKAELIKGGGSIPLGEIPIIVPLKSIDNNNLESYALLGRFPFFRQFDVTFRETTRKLILRSPKTHNHRS